MKAQCLSLDRISTLPSVIIENILSRVPIKDAAKTSILSRNWRYNWLTIPQLEFSEQDFKVTTDENSELQIERKNVSTKFRMVNAVHQILLVHRGPIEEFALRMNTLTFVDKDETFAKVDEIILHLSNNYNTLKKLNLILSIEYRLPSSFFLLRQLTDLSLRNCKFYHHPTTFDGFGSLTSLSVKDVYTNTESLLRLLSNSPLLKSFTLSLSCELHDHSDSTSICDYIDHSSSTISELFKCLPAVEHLNISHNPIKCFAHDDVPQKLPTSLLHLKSVFFNELSLTDKYGLPFILLLIRCSPNLEKIDLTIFDCGDEDVDDDLEIETIDYSDIYLEHLKELNIHILNSFDPEMEYVNAILGKSPVLKKVRIVPYYTFSKEEELTLLKSLLSCPHASPMIDIDVEECLDHRISEEDMIQTTE